MKHKEKNLPVIKCSLLKQLQESENVMSKYECSVCGWVYDEEEGFDGGGIAPGTKFEDFAEDWFCPFCSAGKEKFNKLRGT